MGGGELDKVANGEMERAVGLIGIGFLSGLGDGEVGVDELMDLSELLNVVTGIGIGR